MRRAGLGVASVLLALVGVGSATAAPDTAVVAGPGASRAGSFATPVMTVRPGDQPLLVNGDVVWHAIESVAFGPDERPWCELVDPTRPEGPANPRRRPLGECPLFWANAAVVGGTSPIVGLEGVESGRVYAYRCPVYPEMTGNLFVL